MKYSEFAEKLTEIYNGKFTESKLYIKPWNQFGKSISIVPSLAGNIDECINRIAGNDMFHIKFDIELPENFNFESDDLPENMVLKNLANSYLIIPENKYLCYGRRKISYRKTTGTAEKLLEAFGKFTDKLYQSIIDDRAAGNIHENYIDIVNRKIA
jgi:hypothetical protein